MTNHARPLRSLPTHGPALGPTRGLTRGLPRGLALGICTAALACGAPSRGTDAAHVPGIEARTLEAACGECQFDMAGEGCDLAVRIDGRPYFVEGTSIDQHGDAHAADGFCNAIREARVTGRIEGDVFVATSFELLPPAGATAVGSADSATPAATTHEERLEEARRAWEAEPESEELTIWYGRRLAYVGRFAEAIDVYTRGLEEHPQSHRLRRHRGHRYITTGRYELAIRDLEAAAELIADRPDAVEPDGLPNALGLPRSTDHFNIWYHLALARYLERDFAGAHEAWTRCLDVSRNDDSVCASVYWLTLTCWQLDRPGEAERHRAGIRPDMQVIENTAYHRLLLCQKGALSEEQLWAGVAPGSVDEATIAYGLGCMQRARGDDERARELFQRALDAGVPTAFAAIAAARELATGPRPGGS